MPVLTEAQRNEIRQNVLNGTWKKCEAAKLYGISRSAVSQMCSDKGLERAIKRKEMGMNPDAKKSKICSQSQLDLDQHVLQYINDAHARGIQIPIATIQEVAIAKARELGMTQFRASPGWLQRFKRRYNCTLNANTPPPQPSSITSLQFNNETMEKYNTYVLQVPPGSTPSSGSTLHKVIFQTMPPQIPMYDEYTTYSTNYMSPLLEERLHYLSQHHMGMIQQIQQHFHEYQPISLAAPPMSALSAPLSHSPTTIPSSTPATTTHAAPRINTEELK